MFEFKFADIGEGIHEGKILKWFFEEGEDIKEGDDLFLVETDKVNAEIPSPVSGKLDKKFAEVGDIIQVGQVVARIDDGSDKDLKSVESNKDSKREPMTEGNNEAAGVVGEIEVSSEVIESSTEINQDFKSEKRKVLATPVARKLAKDLGIDINTIKGTGPAGRVMKDDIYKAKESGQIKEAVNKEDKLTLESVVKHSREIEIPKIKTAGEVERVSVSMLRRTIAKNMILSKSLIPHAATMDDFDVSELVRFRKQQKSLALEKGINLTYMPFIIKAVTIALQEFPKFNSSYDQENQELILKKYYNIGIAVDTEDGLMVPVIKNTDNKAILKIAKELENIKQKARNKTISIDELQNGTFSITNYGAVGAKYGIPVIKYPETAILGIGTIEKRPVVVDNEIVIRDILPISLCIDHRVIDGADAGRFLSRLRELLTNPMLLVLS